MQKLRLKHARRRIHVVRDSAGVPHISADSLREGLYGLGYLHAMDRPTQMLFARAMASGTAAERIADHSELLETDELFRRAGLYLHLDREVDRLDDETFAHLTSYCEGVNDGMKQSGRSLPMWTTGFYPKPWNQKAVVLIGQLLSYGGLSIGQQQSERLLLELIQLGIDDAKLRELFAPRLDGIDLELLRKVKISSQLSSGALELIADLPRLVGSNAWAVAPERSASGHALLAADPHLEVNRLPAIWYEAVLRYDGNYVMGATLPGCPLFAVARTAQVAWGVTYMKGDTCDYFIEDCRPGGKAGWQYRRAHRWHDFRVRDETIGRKGAEAIPLRIYENDQGTIEGDPDLHGAGYYLSAAWAGHGEGSAATVAVWLRLIGASGVADAMDIVRACPQPPLCWVMADRRGHIGQQASGWFPKRRGGVTGLLPIPAWDEQNHWQGWIDAAQLPSIYDPPQGFVATANEDVNRPGGPQFVTLPVPDYRRRRIDQRLAKLPAATLDDMQSIQYDVVSLQALDLLEVFLPHLPEGAIKDRLSAWDGSYAPDRVEPSIFTQLYRNVLLEIFGHEEGIGWHRMLYLITRVGFSTMVLYCIDRLLARDASLWWAARDKAALIRRAAERIEPGAAVPWSKTNAFSFSNRFFPRRRVGRALGFHTREVAMPGCAATPFQGHLLRAGRRESTFAPSYHFVADMGRDEAWTNLPGGPSESRFSSYYTSDISLWCEGKYKRLTPEG